MWRCLWFNADFLYSWSYHVPPPSPSPSPSLSIPPHVCTRVWRSEGSLSVLSLDLSLFTLWRQALLSLLTAPLLLGNSLSFVPISTWNAGITVHITIFGSYFLMWILEYRLSDWYGKLFYSSGHLSGPHLAFCCCLFLLLFLTQSLTHPMMALHSQFSWGWLGIPDHIASSGGSVLALQACAIMADFMWYWALCMLSKYFINCLQP